MILAGKPIRNRMGSIQLIEPKSQFELYAIRLSREAIEKAKANPDSTVGDLAAVPTLFQFVAEAYQPFGFYEYFATHNGDDGPYRLCQERAGQEGMLLPRHIETLYTQFLIDPPRASVGDSGAISEALGAIARRANYQRQLLPHPDFTLLRHSQAEQRRKQK